ncbi:hypothetical protein ABFP25_04990 [Acinetobacter indicus]|jgi:hypothetical protein|uniref:Uncharacterized protein n=3 Tax=Acinetobacter TaxID=469 RepID=V2UIY0_9GAMM|nr:MULTISPECIES: hypothetical protein [Acinetobacter]AVH14157.1 hypothetical protein CTZ23_07555 [Acinetobacter indicus]ENW90866.1 hypothetical protein F905_00894 [Acinetobacter sp. CIP 53.82]EPF75253.1 hypothetical protein F956_00153 [Acinetobacter indicus ANC 4215]ESK49917.1 hypothetical protein P253_00774 [Acinetobacter indicus CIP 110367]KJV44492.1 hypothetical protein VH96_06610 [Acinetobacter indicus]
MNDVSLEFLNQAIDKCLKEGKKPKKLRLGYKLYAHFMHDMRFSKEVRDSALDPDKRRYRGIKLKVTQDEYELSFVEKE